MVSTTTNKEGPGMTGAFFISVGRFRCLASQLLDRDGQESVGETGDFVDGVTEPLDDPFPCQVLNRF